MVDRFLDREKTMFYPVVNVLALEANPKAFPTFLTVGMVGMPFARKEHEDVASLDGRLRTMLRLEDTFAFRLVEQLVFIQRPTFLDVEVISIGMSLGRVVFTWLDIFFPHSADGETPLGIPVCS